MSRKDGTDMHKIKSRMIGHVIRRMTGSMISFTAVFIICMSLLVCTLPCGEVYAASSARLSGQYAALDADQTAVIKVKNASSRVKWSVSNRKLVTVVKTGGRKNQKVTVKAGKKKGFCTVKAKVGKKTLKCRVRCTGRQLSLSSSTTELTKKIKGGYVTGRKSGSTFANSAADFSFSLLRSTAAFDHSASENILISPDSVMTALVMAENGAKGRTRSEIKNTVGKGISAADFNAYLSGMNQRLSASKGVEYNVANSIWIRKGRIRMKNSFLKKNRTYHNARIFKAPFSKTTVKDINKWVSVYTDKMVKKIVESLSPDDRVVLINAIAFEGKWADQFSDPQKEIFTRDNGSTQKARMLHQTKQMEYMTVDGGKGFVKYYEGSKIAFVGLLPPEGMDVNTYMSGITGREFIAAWKSKGYRRLDIKIPEFKYDYAASMVAPLKSMGIRTAFSGSADFSGMFVPTTSTRGLCIDEILHKTHIELDKNGTKAAAVTAIMMKASAAMPQDDPVTEVHLDRPFVYALVDCKTGIPLFLGVLKHI